MTMKTTLTLLATVLAVWTEFAETADVLRTVADVDAAVSRRENGTPFDVTAQIILPGVPGKTAFFALDKTGGAWFGTDPRFSERCPTNAGDIVRLQGETVFQSRENRRFIDHGAESRTVKTIGHAPLPEPTAVTAQDIYNKRFLNAYVRLDGVVRDALRDEIDPSWLFLTLSASNDIVTLVWYAPQKTTNEIESLIGSHVSVTGICQMDTRAVRKNIGHVVCVHKLNILEGPPDALLDRFNAPSLADLHFARPSDLFTARRYRATGRVIAVWNKSSILMRTSDAQIIRVNLISSACPSYDATIEAVGFPETDFYNINLSRAIWRSTAAQPSSEEEAQIVSIGDLVSNKAKQRRIAARYHGRLLRIQGVVRSLPVSHRENARIYLEDNHALFPIDVGSCPDALKDLSVGCRLEVTGTCVIETDSWHASNIFPRITDILLVVRTPTDLHILSHPSWWTPGRLLALLGIFAAALLGVIGWNVSLNRRAKAKGRELAAEQLAHVTSELKVSERTRLAVELHDALSQTLTGVSMQIDTAAGFAGGKTPAITKCLDLASRTIDACRMELRNTLWDLRSAALDEPSMDAAILKTLRQNLACIDLSVRFNVPRETFSDNTAHAILRIIRELATNALRHGKATSLKIAGTIDGDKLLFSVRDNGCGFDPDLAPGISQGHFGLQGIAERLERLYGEMKIESSPGKGAKVTVTLPIPRSGE